MKYGTTGNAIQNIIFNLGYMFGDIQWFVLLESTEPQYFYRVGFVAGDFYMRFFTRSLTDVDVVY